MKDREESKIMTWGGYCGEAGNSRREGRITGMVRGEGRHGEETGMGKGTGGHEG